MIRIALDKNIQSKLHGVKRFFGNYAWASRHTILQRHVLLLMKDPPSYERGPGKFVLLVRTQGFLGYISNMAAVLHGRRVVDLLPVKIVSERFYLSHTEIVIFLIGFLFVCTRSLNIQIQEHTCTWNVEMCTPRAFDWSHEKCIIFRWLGTGWFFH